MARLPHQVMAGGQTTVDDDFNELDSQLKQLEVQAQKLRGDAEKFKGAVLASMDHQEKMAQVLAEVRRRRRNACDFAVQLKAPDFSEPPSQAYQPIPSKVLSPTGQQKTITQASEESQRVVQEYADAMRTAKEELVQDLVRFRLNTCAAFENLILLTFVF